MAMDLIKENIECEQLLGENFCDTVVKSEYIIPDTNPDVSEVLMLQAKPYVTSTEVVQDKIFVEGQVNYTILYLAMEDEKTGVYSANYTGKFSNYVELNGVDHKMICDSECYVEHMECVIVNERKISIEGIVKLKAEVYKKYNFEVIKDVTGSEDVQMLKNPTTVDKIVGSVSGDIVAKYHIQIPMDSPQIGNMLKCDINIHKKDVKVLEGKISVEACALVNILYRAKDGREIIYTQEDIPISKEMELEGVNPSMENYTDFRVEAVDFGIKEDDLGESRILDVESLVRVSTKVMCKQDMDIIEDAYSPSLLMNMKKKDYELNVMHGQSKAQSIIKGNVELADDIPKIAQIIMCCGKVCVIDKKLVEDKVVMDGVLNVQILYKTFDEDKYIYTVEEEIPFSSAVEIPGCKIDMQCIVKTFLENIEASIEIDTIAVKALVDVYARVNYLTHKEFLVDVEPDEGELPIKKSSLTIYVVQNGDTLWKIAKKYFTTVDNLVKLNEIEDPDVIKVGDKLIIPGRAII